jgi:hypothetical protein
MKQETLEEVALKYATNHGMMAYVFPEKKESFIAGAKWQQERSYSEEDMKESFYQGWVLSGIGISFKDAMSKFFEQFKNK